MKFWLLLLLALPVCARAVTDSAEWSDSGIWGPKYEKILSEMDRWQKEFSDFAEVQEYGKSVQGKPLRMLVVRREGAFTERPTLIMTGSTHGNEYLNLEDRLPELLMRRARSRGPVAEFLEQGGAFVFIPVVNPDGYDARQRENAHGVDLNRDWDVAPAGFKSFKEIESRSLAEKLEAMHGEKKLQYRITVDYHCCQGALLHPWAYRKSALPEIDAFKHASISELAAKNLDIEVGNTVDILGYTALGTTKDYYYTRYGAMAFTYEGRQTVERKYLERHLNWWEAMVNMLVEEANRPFLAFIKSRPHPFFRIAD